MDAYPLDWESLWAFIPIVCASIGICITLDVVAVFIIYNKYVSTAFCKEFPGKFRELSSVLADWLCIRCFGLPATFKG